MISSWLATLPLVCFGKAAAVTSNTCKSFPGTDSWPSLEHWGQLNRTLDGRLIEPSLPAQVCHEPNFNKEECLVVQKAWTRHAYHVGDPASLMLGNWAATTCSPDPNSPCSRAGYPVYVVNATTPKHAQVAVSFARKHGIRLNIKGTGHDFLGRSSAPGSLSIWTHYINSTKFHKGQFKLAGSGRTIPGDALSVGAGLTMYEVYKAAAEHNTAVVGGAAKTVGVGGHISGGGHGMLGPDYGLGADNVLQMEVVTPEGKILTVNEDQSPDLFWALRGGGGSTFGVVTSLTLRAHPSPRVLSVNLYAAIPYDSPFRDDFTGFVLGQMPSLMDDGLRGYCVFSSTGHAPVPFPGMPVPLPGTPSGKRYVACTMALMDRTLLDLAGILTPLNNTIQTRFGGDGTIFTDGVKAYGSWLDWFEVNYDQTSAGGTGVLESWLLDKKSLTKDPHAVVKAFTAASKAYDGTMFFPLAGKGVQEAKPRGGSNAANPGWRKAYIHFLNLIAFDPLNKTSETEAVKTLRDMFEPARELAPGMGAYINEASLYEPDPARSFWGDNYGRLLKIKRSVDPDNLFWCGVCVGNEGWEQLEDGRLCKKAK